MNFVAHFGETKGNSLSPRYQASRSLAILKADRREKRDDREGLKRLQQALKDDGTRRLTTPGEIG